MAESETILADTPKLLAVARDLRRRAYSGEVDDVPDATADAYDELPATRTFLARENGSFVGTIRFCVHSCESGWLPLSAFEMFPEELAPFRERRTLVQSSHYAFAPDARGADLSSRLRLLRAFLATCLEVRAALGISVISDRPSNVGFYSRLAFRTLSEPRMHPWARRSCVLIGVEPEAMLAAARSNRRLHAVAEGLPAHG